MLDTPVIPLHRYTRALFTAISRVASSVLSVTDWIGLQLHISSRFASRAGFLVLWGIAMTLIQVDEYGLALFLWTLSAIVLVSKAIHWKGFAKWPRATKLLRIAYFATAIGFVCLAIVWTQAKRGTKPWTSLMGSTQYFVGTLDLTFSALDSGQITRFFVLNEQSKLIPANAALYITLTNRRSIPAKIDGLSLELNCPPRVRRWVRCYRIDTTNKFSVEVFMAEPPPGSSEPNLKNATLIDYDNLSAIMATEVFSPGVSRGGFLFLEYPMGLSCSDDPQFRVRIHDSLGDTTTVILPKDNAHPSMDWVNPWIHIRYIQRGVDIIHPRIITRT